MNIVFITDNYVDPTSGGIARTTHILAQALVHTYNYCCYSVYANTPIQQPSDENVFTWAYQWEGQEDFYSKVQALNGCILIIQSPCTLIRSILQMALPSTRIIYVFHGTPGFELIPLRWPVACYRLTHAIAFKQTLKQLAIQVLQRITSKQFLYKLIQTKYTLPIGKVDRMVVLSQGIIDQYLAIGNGNANQFSVIPNPTVFPLSQEVPVKQKEVLIVARLDDWHKRIFDALRIWRQLQMDAAYQDWILRIMGDGIDLPFYKRYVQRKHIPNVFFEGHQAPQKYYQRASLFMMTSACEGFPMTLLEAEQFGCIPVAFNNFASAQDIICDGKNGFLISNNDVGLYIQKLQQLMSDKSLRESMSRQCVDMSECFTIENIAKQWNQLFLSL